MGPDPQGSYLDRLKLDRESSYVVTFKKWLVQAFPDRTPVVHDFSMAKATAGVASRCSTLNLDEADIVILELLHDEQPSNEEVDKVAGVRCAMQTSCQLTSVHAHEMQAQHCRL
jgi:hypothetical protein